MKQKYVMTNLVYGQTYAHLFLNNQLKSILDPSNLPAIADKYDIEYHIFTDQQTIPMLNSHERFVELTKLVKVDFHSIDWPPNIMRRFDFRYNMLCQMFNTSVEIALEKNAWFTAWVADLVVAKDFFPRIMKRMEEGHDGVLMLPLRSAAESVNPILDMNPDAYSDVQLCSIGYANLHPLWNACHWNTDQFTKLPFTLLWNSGSGLLARSFSLTPIIMKAYPEMLECEGVIDRQVPALLKNPYWCEDWTDAPVIGVEPLFCYYPTFDNKRANAKWVSDWTQGKVITGMTLHKSQIPHLKRILYYPSKAIANMDQDTEVKSDLTVHNITEHYNNDQNNQV